MRITGVIRIQKRTQPEWLIWLLVIMPFLFGGLCDLLHLPSAIKYMLDLVNVLLLLYLIVKFRYTSAFDGNLWPLGIWLVVLLSITVMVYMVQYQSILYYIWGIRNNFRYYILFFAAALFLKKRDISWYFALFDKVFWVNAVISVAQYFVFGIYGDNLGGLFGTDVGCNAYTNIFFVIITAKSAVFYLNKQEKLPVCLIKCAVMMAIAAFAELKFFYIEALLIIAMAVLLTDFSWRKLLFILCGIVIVLLGANILIRLFPNSAGFLRMEGIMRIAASQKGYTSSGDLNRLTAISIISDKFLKTFPQRLFGLGLGNCETANFSFLITPFYKRYAYLRYFWFSIAFWFLETGYLGLVMFNGFFALVFILCARMKKVTVQDKCNCQIAMIVAVCCVMVAVYNSTLRTEAGYMAYFVLALPFVKAEETLNVTNPRRVRINNGRK